MTKRERELIRKFASKCERLWPGCAITIRQEEINHPPFLAQQESAADAFRQNEQKETEK